MALVLKDRVKETTTTTGTGALTLLGASTGYQSFAAIGNGNTCYYAISSTGGSEWEVGIGTYTASGTLLSRDTILESSTGGGAISLSAGTKDVYVVYPAEKGVWLDASGNVVQNQFTSMNVTGTATINVATLTSGTISTAANAATDIVNKAYVDNAVAAGVHFHTPVRVESPTALNAAYNNGTSGVGATLTNSGTNVAIQVDGVSLNVTDRVLIYTQSNATHNGVYVVSTQGAPDSPGPGAKWVLTRSDDTDTYVTDSPAGLSQGSTFFVQQGATGAGETYTCNTPGTIVFGTTNITFAQVSSAQIYSAGTGLNLNSTTFSIANTTVTPATYGTSGQVAQIAINAQGQITSASNVGIAITASNVSGLAASATTDTTNASNITSGTLINARTTASANNGASTIIARDASGNFAAAGITGTTFTGNGALITALNGTAISTGTVANARTTATDANGASTIVARNASGNFSANVITATTFSGSGASVTGINASNITAGTLAITYGGTGATVAATALSNLGGVPLAGGVNMTGSLYTRGSFGMRSSSIAGNPVMYDVQDQSGATVLEIGRADNVAATTAMDIHTGATSTDFDTRLEFTGGNGTSGNGNLTIRAATLSLASPGVYSGNGSGLTTLNATALTSGTVPSARVSGSYTGITGVGTLTAGTWNATAITDTYLATISTAGKVSNSATTATNSNGASTIVARDANGSFAANVGTFTTITGAGSGITGINASTITTGTLPNAQTTASSSNGASTIVARDAGGNFAANTITANLTGNASGTAGSLASAQNFSITNGATAAAISFNGTGAVALNVTAINASVISTGTIANARTTASDANGASTIVARDASGNFSANVITANGSALTALNASNISTGTLANARTTATSANGASTIVARDANGSFSANVGTFVTLSGAGGAITALNASNLASGTAPVARLAATGTPSASTFLRGDSSWTAVPSPNNGTLTMNVAGTGLSGSATFTADQAGASTFTVTSNASSANGASTIVARDASGNFTANVGTFTTVTGAGSGLTSLNASNLASGTVGTARLASGTANSSTFLRGDSTWATVASSNITALGLYENSNTIAANYTIANGNNAMSAGPITVNAGATVTVPSGSTWTIV